MTQFSHYNVPYPVDPRYTTKAAYFSMEFAVHQPLKIYSGGLGFLVELCASVPLRGGRFGAAGGRLRHG